MRFSAVGASLFLAGAARAFRDTSPLLVWSSTDNDEIREAASEVSSGVVSADGIFHSLHSMGCDWDTVVVAHVDELHESHLDKLSGPYATAKADLHIPYLVKPERESLNEAIDMWAHRCGADLADSYKANGGRTVVYMNAAHASDVTIPSDLPERHIVIVTGTRDPALAKGEREIETSETGSYEQRPTVEEAEASKLPSKNRTGGDDDEAPPAIYFTAPLITGLLIFFGILFPICIAAIKMLHGVQVPPRMMEIGKVKAVTKDRKDQ